MGFYAFFVDKQAEVSYNKGRKNSLFAKKGGRRGFLLVVFEWIAKTFGWYISTLLYIPTVCLGAFLIFLPIHLVAKRKAGKAL